MKLTTYSVGALAFTALSGAMPTRPRLIANAPATITAPSIDSSLPTLQASFFRESEQSDMVPRLYINKAPLPTGDADIHSDNGLIPRGRNRKDPKSSKATTSKAHMLTTTVTFGTTAFASEQTDSYGDITGDKKSTYYLKFTDELPWTSTRTTTHTYVHVTPIEAEATELQARAPRTTTPTSTQPDLGDPATFKYISFSRTSWITSRTTQVEIIRWPPKTRGEWPHYHRSSSTASVTSTGKHGKISSSATKKASSSSSKVRKPTIRTKMHKSRLSSTAIPAPSISSYVDSFEWSKTHIFEPEPTPVEAKRAINLNDLNDIRSNVREAVSPTASTYVDSFEWSKTHKDEPETSATEPPSLSKRAMLSTRAFYVYDDSPQWSSTSRMDPIPTSSFQEIYESWEDDDDDRHNVMAAFEPVIEHLE